MIKQWIQRFLGITDVYNQINELNKYNTGTRGQLTNLSSQISVMNRAFGRVIAKVDPMYLVPEDDPARKAASDKLGDEVIRKLTGEDHFSNRTRNL